MRDELINIKNIAVSFILDSQDKKTLEEVRMQFLGRSGKLTIAMKNIIKVPIEDRRDIGQLANEIKRIVEEAINQKIQTLTKFITEERRSKIDLSIPGILPEIGHLHPMTQILYDVVDVFKTIGFQAADGPEIESDYYNFEVLNIPKNHPARDTQQTFYLNTRDTNLNPGEIILRTQTSAMQGRVMEKTKPPLRVIVPGKNFRYEQVDASHGFEFWQVE